MSDINWKGTDLNLLLSFQALMQCRSVSRAAERLFLGQSAMSYNLNRLRRLFGDPLFVRQGNYMVPTRRAEELAPKVNGVLEVIRSEILFPPAFDPAVSRQKIRIGLSDYAELAFGPSLYERLIAESPQSQIVFRAIDSTNVERELEAGTVDVAVGVFSLLDERFSRTLLYRERHVCLFDNRVLNVTLPISLDDYLATPQVMIAADGELESPVDDQLSMLGKSRRVVLGTSRFLTLRHLLTGRRLICTVAEKLGCKDLFGHGLSLSLPPLDIADFDVEMVVRGRDSSHPRLEWLTDRIGAVVKEEAERTQMSM